MWESHGWNLTSCRDLKKHLESDTDHIFVFFHCFPTKKTRRLHHSISPFSIVTSHVFHCSTVEFAHSTPILTPFFSLLGPIFAPMSWRRCPRVRGKWMRTWGSWWKALFLAEIGSGWWFGTFYIFPYIGFLIIPLDFHIFQRGGPTTNMIG